MHNDFDTISIQNSENHDSSPKTFCDETTLVLTETTVSRISLVCFFFIFHNGILWNSCTNVIRNYFLA